MFARQRQIAGGAVGVALQQRGNDLQRSIIVADGQLDRVRGVRGLPVDRLVGRQPLCQRHAHAHVEFQLRNPRLFGGEHGPHVRAGDHAIGCGIRVVEHVLLAADRHRVALHPRGVARADHEQPSPVAALLRDHHRRAWKDPAFLETVDVGVALFVEHARRGREGTQVGAAHHQTVARGLRGRNRVQCKIPIPRIQIGGGDFVAVHVVERAVGAFRQFADPSFHLVGSQLRGQPGDVVHRRIAVQDFRVLRVDRRLRHQHRIRRRRAFDPEIRRQLRVGHADHAAGRDRGRIVVRAQRRCEAEQGGQNQAEAQAHDRHLDGSPVWTSTV